MAKKKAVKEVLEVAPDLVASPEVAVSAATPRRRVSGDELRANLRQQRREARLAEKGY